MKTGNACGYLDSTVECLKLKAFRGQVHVLVVHSVFEFSSHGSLNMAKGSGPELQLRTLRRLLVPAKRRERPFR